MLFVFHLSSFGVLGGLCFGGIGLSWVYLFVYFQISPSFCGLG